MHMELDSFEYGASWTKEPVRMHTEHRGSRAIKSSGKLAYLLALTYHKCGRGRLVEDNPTARRPRQTGYWKTGNDG